MKAQQGSTLIMVLIVLLLITLIGTMAMRESLLNLRLSTNTQVNNVLLNSNDTALFELEDAQKVRGRLNSRSVYGYFDAQENAEDELVFCFEADKQQRFFSMSRVSIIGGKKGNNSGYCTTKKFSVGRAGVISQVYVRKLNLDDVAERSGSTLSSYSKGVSVGQQTFANIKHVAVTTISVMPSFSRVQNESEINECFKKSAKIEKNQAVTKNNNVEQCFKELNVPYNMQYAEYSVGSEPG